MRRRDLLTFFALEIFAAIWAGAVFSIFTSRLLAAGLAGAFFVGSGVFMVWRTSRWGEKWKSPTWYASLIHLFVISLPMVIMRFTHPSQPFDSIQIWGLPGPVFHQLSTAVFCGLILSTVVDWARAGRKPAM